MTRLDSIRKNLGPDFADWLEKTMAGRDAITPRTHDQAIALRKEIGNLVAERTHLLNAEQKYSAKYRAVD